MSRSGRGPKALHRLRCTQNAGWHGRQGVCNIHRTCVRPPLYTPPWLTYHTPIGRGYKLGHALFGSSFKGKKRSLVLNLWQFGNTNKQNTSRHAEMTPLRPQSGLASNEIYPEMLLGGVNQCITGKSHQWRLAIRKTAYSRGMPVSVATRRDPLPPLSSSRC